MPAFFSAVCQPTVTSFAGVGLFVGNFLAVKTQHLIENFLSPSLPLPQSLDWFEYILGPQACPWASSWYQTDEAEIR